MVKDVDNSVMLDNIPHVINFNSFPKWLYENMSSNDDLILKSIDLIDLITAVPFKLTHTE